MSRGHYLVEVAKIDEIPSGARKLVEVGGRQIGIFHLSDTFVAVLNVCPHELAPVCLGRVTGTTLPSPPGVYIWGREGEILACPWHGWEFDLVTGQALADRRRLRMFPVVVRDDALWIEVPASYIGGSPDDPSSAA